MAVRLNRTGVAEWEEPRHPGPVIKLRTPYPTFSHCATHFATFSVRPLCGEDRRPQIPLYKWVPPGGARWDVVPPRLHGVLHVHRLHGRLRPAARLERLRAGGSERGGDRVERVLRVDAEAETRLPGIPFDRVERAAL